MAEHNDRPQHHTLTIPGNGLIAADTQQTLISTRQVICLIRLLTEVEVNRIDDEAQLGLQHVLHSIDQALEYESQRLAPE